MPFWAGDTDLRQVVSSQFRGAFSLSRAVYRAPARRWIEALGARESPLVRTVLGRRRWCRVVVVGRGRVRWGWVVAGPGVAGSLPVVRVRPAVVGGRRWRRRVGRW